MNNKVRGREKVDEQIYSSNQSKWFCFDLLKQSYFWNHKQAIWYNALQVELNLNALTGVWEELIWALRW